MKAFFALAAYTLSVVPALVAADFVPAGSAAHFFSTQNTSLVFAPQGAFNGAPLQASLAGDGSSNDITALFVEGGTGGVGQIVIDDWCISARGVVPESATQTLFIEDCSNDPKQLWTVNVDPPTVSNADGNCITLGRPAVNVPIVLDFCEEVIQEHQLWNPVPVA